jgi:hypothetical protein
MKFFYILKVTEESSRIRSLILSRIRIHLFRGRYRSGDPDPHQYVTDPQQCVKHIFFSALRKHGVKKGDRVVGYIPNCAEAIEAMAATAAIGAIWSSTSPDFGVSGVLDRFSQIQPKVRISSVLYLFFGVRGVFNQLSQIQLKVRLSSLVSIFSEKNLPVN